MNAEVYPSPDGWRFRVKGDNGEIMAVGESYVRRIDAESALQTLFTSGPIDVTVRAHTGEVVEHYTLRPPAPPDSAEDISAAPDYEQPELPFENRNSEMPDDE